jgi:predicted nucleic acid-binding protein
MDALLDAAIVVDPLRGYPPALVWSQANKHLNLGITPAVWLEVVVGTPNKIKQNQATGLLSTFPLVYWFQSDFDWAMQQLSTFHLSHNIDPFDCLIASVNYRLQLPLYTHNLKHFTPLLGALAQKPY